MKRSDKQRKVFSRHKKALMKSPEFRDAFDEGLDDLRIAVKIAQLRKKHGISQTELAARIKTSASIISRIENGRNMELKTLKKIAEALDAELKIEFVEH